MRAGKQNGNGLCLWASHAVLLCAQRPASMHCLFVLFVSKTPALSTVCCSAQENDLLLCEVIAGSDII